LETVSTAVPSLQPDFSTRLLGRSEALQQMIQTSDPLTTQRVVDWFASFRGVLAVSLTNSAGGDASGGQFPEKAGGDVLARQAASLMNQARTLVTKDHLGEPSVVSVRADRGVLTILRAERLTLAVIHDASPAFNDEAAKRMLEGALELDRLLAVDAKR
jgi:predicted regulator of Ras-like GTPase activity (Roadblock/LC7/MglB family)